MYGTEKQIKWAHDIKDRLNSYKMVLNEMRLNTDNKDLLRLISKIENRIGYILGEQNASSVIHYYGYVGLVSKNGKYQKNLEKFLLDMVDVDEILLVQELLKIA